MPEKIDLKRPVKIFTENNIVLFPTDTVVGLGCRFDSKDAIERIRKIKGIQDKNPLAVLISGIDQLDELKIRKSRLALELMEHFWPGALTIVLTTEGSYPCCGEANTMGLRLPDDPLLRRIIELVKLPIAATSANFHGHIAPAKLKDVSNKISDAADFILDLPIVGAGIASTVVKIEAGLVRIMREGAVTKKELIEIVGENSIT